MNIGEKIKELRKKNGLTQEKLADCLCVSYQAVSKWENGAASPDLSLIAPLTRILHVTADELLGIGEAEPDARYEELKKEYDLTFATEDSKRRQDICQDQHRTEGLRRSISQAGRSDAEDIRRSKKIIMVLTAQAELMRAWAAHFL